VTPVGREGMVVRQRLLEEDGHACYTGCPARVWPDCRRLP
jgi:hypothetical protein